jgi:aquaporin Z
MKRGMAEFIGTCALVFAGTGAIVVNETSGGTVTHVGIALTFGLIVVAVVYTFGDISGAHLNPAVTIGFWTAQRISSPDVLLYAAAQLAGAFSASASLRLLFPQSKWLGARLPAGSDMQSFVL